MDDNPFPDSDEDDSVQFTDAVRNELPHWGEPHQNPYERENPRTYRDQDNDSGADDVDPFRLFRRTTVPELRFYYREGEFASTIVNKPIEDAFKNGFTVNEQSNGTDARDFLTNYVPKMRVAEKKARRDGFAVIEFKTRERGGANINEPPSDVTEIAKLKVWTLDDLSPDVTDHEVIQNVDYDLDPQDVHQTENGIVVLDDPSHPDHEELLGYGLRMQDETTEFLHADRTQHFAWNTEVDGNPSERAFGRWEGDSVLTPIVHVMRQIKKGNWGMGEALFRYSSPLHVVETPMEMNQEQWHDLQDEVDGLNSASEFVSSPGTEVKGIDSASEFDPEPFYDVLVEQICSATEFTKPVLIGTQTGTVSGSETDVKSYFNQVQRYRQNRAETKMNGALKMASQFNKSIVPPISTGKGVWFDWAPLFKVDQIERAEALRTTMNAATQGVQNYVFTPDEARKFVEAEYVKFDTDIELDELTESEFDQFDRVNLRKTGTGSKTEDEPEMGNPRVGQNGGGREGTGGGQSDPTTDRAIDFGEFRGIESANTDTQFSDAPTQFADEQQFHSGDKVATPNGAAVVSDVYDRPINFNDTRIEASEDNYVYVVGFGGSSLPYRADPLELNENLEDYETEGEALAPELEDVGLDEIDLPPSWQNSDTPTDEILLDFWSSVGGEQSQAANEMTSWQNVTEDEANAMAAEMKTAALGTWDWTGHGGFAIVEDES